MPKMIFSSDFVYPAIEQSCAESLTEAGAQT